MARRNWSKRAAAWCVIRVMCCVWVIISVFPSDTSATNANLSHWMKNLSEPTVDEQTGLRDLNPEIEVVGSTVHVMWITQNTDPAG